MRHFTNSTTFDVNYLFGNNTESSTKRHHSDKHFTNDATFDVEKLFEK
ncbi:MAG: hypothetical protein PUD43_01040 [Clostridia bacterium]|nr:hypothetical protein [Clostridia bacterium]